MQRALNIKELFYIKTMLVWIKGYSLSRQVLAGFLIYQHDEPLYRYDIVKVR